MKKESKKFTLIIKPAIPPEARHQIQEVLKKMGYYVTGGGGYVDG